MSEDYSTKAAARYLEVSEASVRRWSDSGALRAQRSGRRGTRRFAEADLRAFAESGRARTGRGRRGQERGSIRVGNLNLDVHAHLPTFFETDTGRLRLSVPFLRDGLLAGETCFLYAFDDAREAYLQALRSEERTGVDAALREGRLVLLPRLTTSSSQFLGRWEDVLLEAMAIGPTLIRIVGDMSSVRTMFSSDDDLADFETSFNVIARRFPLVALCQYNVREIDGHTFLREIKAHPDVFTTGLANLLC